MEEARCLGRGIQADVPQLRGLVEARFLANKDPERWDACGDHGGGGFGNVPGIKAYGRDCSSGSSSSPPSQPIIRRVEQRERARRTSISFFEDRKLSAFDYATDAGAVQGGRRKKNLGQFGGANFAKRQWRWVLSTNITPMLMAMAMPTFSLLIS